jgi:hypothetical protein
MIVQREPQLNIQLNTVRYRGEVMVDTERTRMRRLIDKSDRWDRYWARIHRALGFARRSTYGVTAGKE